MAYGDYSGPDKPNKGKEGGACNRGSCQDEPALWFNHGSSAWYCSRCRDDIEFDKFNLADWQKNWQPRLGHGMFETRPQIDARATKYAKEPHDDRCAVTLSKGRYVCNCALAAFNR